MRRSTSRSTSIATADVMLLSLVLQLPCRQQAVRPMLVHPVQITQTVIDDPVGIPCGDVVLLDDTHLVGVDLVDVVEAHDHRVRDPPRGGWPLCGQPETE